MRNCTVPAIDATRHSIAQDATFEIQALALKLRSVLEGCFSEGQTEAIARGVLTRISDLSDIIFESVIQDEEDRESANSLMKKLGTTHAARYAREKKIDKAKEPKEL